MTRNEEGLFQIAETVDGSTERTITLTRISAFSNPERPVLPLEDTDSLWPQDDLFGWFENLSEDLSIDQINPGELSGQRATRFLISVRDDAVCVASDECAFVATNGPVTTEPLAAGESQGFWYLGQGDEDAILAVITDPRSDRQQWLLNVDRQWLQTVDNFLGTIELGEALPNPVNEN